MEVEVVTPDEYMGEVIGDLSTRAAAGSLGWKRADRRQAISRRGAAGDHVRLRDRRPLA